MLVGFCPAIAVSSQVLIQQYCWVEVASCGVGLKYKQRMVGYSLDVHATVAQVAYLARPVTTVVGRVHR